ncbi:MAG: outer membrane protein assembly factor BamD [Bdellovibrionales bacterium]|nr:outer membrane protein assembly factor BamD [Bdellovibrionales bacterium]
MNKRAIIFASIAMTFIGLLFLADVRYKLNTAKEHKELAEFWKKKVAREQLKKLIALGKFADFKQEVAVLIPEMIIEKRKAEAEKQKLRDMASVIPHEPTHEISLGFTAEKILNMGKEKVKKREYKEGVQILERLIHKFPDSHHVVEAHYLIIEAFARQEKNSLVVDHVEKMVELFPENRLTGFALLKVGDVYEIDGRHEDAIRIYKTIVAVYKDPKLLKEAKKAVKEPQL